MMGSILLFRSMVCVSVSVCLQGFAGVAEGYFAWMVVCLHAHTTRVNTHTHTYTAPRAGHTPRRPDDGQHTSSCTPGAARAMRSVAAVSAEEGWGWSSWRLWLLKHKLVWIDSAGRGGSGGGESEDGADGGEASDYAGTGVDLYLWVVTPELFALMALFVGLLYSGSDDDGANKLQTLASGSVVDWQTLGWVLLAFLQFLIIVVDRVLYLRRSIFSKAVLQVATLILYFSIFFLRMRQPLLTDSRAFVLLLFLLKCSYWVFSARQIRLGYPKGLTSGGPSQSANYFFRDFSFGGYCAYMVYLGAPFLSDMRCMLDWTCTPTTLDFFQWLTMENIYSVLYQREVTLAYRRTLQRHFGAPQPWVIKWSTGVSFFTALALVIWGPLLVSVVSAKYAQPQSAPVVGVRMEVGIATSAGDQFALSELSSFAQAPVPVAANCSTAGNSSLAKATWWLPAEEQTRALHLLQTECTLKDTFAAVYMSSERDVWQSTPKRRSLLSAALAKALASVEDSEDNSTAVGVWLQVLVLYTRNTSGLSTLNNNDAQYQSTVLQRHTSDHLSAPVLTRLLDMLAVGHGSVTIPGAINPLVLLTSDAAVPLYTSRGGLQGVNLTLNRASESSSSIWWWAVCCDGGSDYCRDSAANPVLDDGDNDGCAGIWFVTSSQPVGGVLSLSFSFSLSLSFSLSVCLSLSVCRLVGPSVGRSHTLSL